MTWIFGIIFIIVGLTVTTYKLIKAIELFNSYNCPKCKKLTKHREIARHFKKQDTNKNFQLCYEVTYECSNCSYHWKNDIFEDYSI